MGKSHGSEETMSPFPVMTPGQRLFFEVNGYVVIEDTLTADEVKRTKDAVLELRRQFEASGDPDNHKINGGYVESCRPHYFHAANLLETNPAIFDYLTHPTMVGLAEEVMGGKVRLEESAVVINRRHPDDDASAPFKYNFHRGGQPELDSYSYDDLYHCMFVKTLTNLTDLGAEDGGTTVIAGSHKLNCSEDDMVAAAYENPTMIHQVEAPAGSTMVMCETLIHATGFNRTDCDRIIIIAGYSHPKHRAAGALEPSQQFLETLSDEQKMLVAGHPYWTWPERHRPLGMMPRQKDIPYKARMWSVTDHS